MLESRLIKRLAIASVLAGTVMVVVALPVRAAEWAAEPSLTVRGEYNSNLLLTPFPHKGLWGSWTSPGMKFKGSTENFEMSGSGLVDFVRYEGSEGVKYTNIYLPLSMKYKHERDQFGLSGGYTRDNTLLTELQETGIVNIFRQRDFANVMPTWTHAFTETTSIQNSYQFSDVQYDNGGRVLFDYQTHIGSSSLSHQLTEHDQIQLTGTYVNFHVPLIGLRSTFYGAQAGLSHQFTETFNASAYGGFKRIQSAIHQGGQTQRDKDQTVLTYSATLFKQFESTSFALAYSRDLYPSGIGVLIQNDRVSGTVEYKLTERLTGFLTSEYHMVEFRSSTATIGVLPNNRYLKVEPKLRYRFNDWWSVDALYRYARSEVAQFDRIGEGNVVSLSVTYTGDKFSVSR